MKTNRMKFKFLMIQLIIIICTSHLISQDNSQNTSLSKETQDKISNLYLNAHEIKSANPKRAISIGEKIIKISTEKEFLKGVGYGYEVIGMSQLNLLNYSKAIANINMAIKTFTKFEDSSNLANNYVNLGVVYKEASIIDNAVASYITAIDIYEKQKDSANLGRTLYNFANIHLNYDNFSQATKYISKASDIFTASDNKMGIGMCQLVLGDINKKQKKYNEAMAFYNDALKNINNSFKPGLLGIYNGMGDLEFERKNNQLAEKYYNLALSIAKEIKLLKNIAEISLGLAEIKISNKDYDSALIYLNDAEKILNNTINISSLKLLYSAYSNLYEKTGDFQLAYKYSKMTMAVNDSLYNIEMLKKAAENDIVYSVKEKDKYIELLTQEKRIKELEANEIANEKKYFFYGIIALIVLVIILSLLILFNLFKNKQKRNLEKELLESNLKISQLLQTTDQGIYGIDVEGKCTFINNSGLKMLGYELAECIGKNMHDLIHHSHLNSTTYLIEQCPIFNTLNKGNSNRFDNEVFWKKDNNSLLVEYSSYPIYENNKISGAVITFSDITHRKEMENEQIELLSQLRESNEIIEANLYQKNNLIEELTETTEILEKTNSEKDKFFSILAHDIKSPFAGFLSLTKLMAEEYNKLSIEDVQILSKDMHSSADNLFKLLENLLEWSRMKRGITDFNPEQCFLQMLVKQNIDVQTEVAKQKEINLINNIDNSKTVYADIPMLNTVLRNLISNAIKFTPRGGDIEIGIKNSDNGKSNLVFVRDSGIGMSDDIVNKLFKIDQKVSRPGTEDEPSTGLGLLLCKEFIEKHNGKIWVESEVGKGSTFWFELPK